MKRFILLFTLLLAGAAHAESGGLCKPLCESDKRECRKDAASQADEDSWTLLEKTDKNPTARVTREMGGKPSDAQDRQGYENRRVKLQRACDTKYLRCVQDCARQEASAPPARAQ